MELEKDTLLHGGTYRIEKTLGQGSFGITYLVTHTALNRKVAIKEFFMKGLNTRGDDGSISGMTDGSLSYNYGQKFKKEAMNLSQLDHPNIVRVIDSFEENGTYYYVMDYIEGENLNDYLKHNAVSQQEAVSIITDVAKALQYMHDTKHMLHLDLKPGNIMRRASDGHIFLIDFGLSKHYSNSGQPETSTTIGLGTPGYAPIEQSNQAKNGEFRPTIDVYALGATLYKLLTRETPPPASDIVSDDELIEDKLRANGITGNIIDVVVNAMLPNVKKRTQTIKAFLNELNYNSTSSNITSNATSAQKEEVNPVNEETCIIGQSNPSIEKIASVKTQAFNIDQYNIPSHYLADPKNTEYLAMEGNPEAMFAFAMMYLRGEGKFQNFEIAHKWLHKCKANGDGRAEVLLKNWEWLKKKYTKKTTTRPANEEKLTPSDDKKKPEKNIVWGALIILLIIFGTIVVCTNQSDSTTNMPSNVYVENFYYAKGGYYWTGQVKNDVPDGYGTATYPDSDKDGRSSYRGEVVDGIRQGEGNLTYKNGDRYKGTFRNGYFDSGTYYSYSSGEYYTGEFYVNQPINGKWYNRNGKVISNAGYAVDSAAIENVYY